MIKLQLASESGANGYSLAYHRMNWPSRIDRATKYCSDIERGMCGMSIETMLAIAKALDMNLDYMMFGEISETEREWQQKDALTLIHIIEKGARLPKKLCDTPSQTIYCCNRYFLYIDPFFFTTSGTVRKSIFTSVPDSSLKCNTGPVPQLFSKSVILLRPLTCHIPVIPGLMARRLLWCSSYLTHSSSVGGLVPTRDISPFKTFQNCGNSSKDQSRIKFPIPFFTVPSGSCLQPMMRGSKIQLKHQPVRDSVFLLQAVPCVLLHRYTYSGTCTA